MHLSFTASLLGVSDQLTECTESVTAVPKSSTIGGTVTGGPGAGVVLTLTPGGATTVTNAAGGYGFASLGAGAWTVTMTVPDGYTASGPTSVGVTVDGSNSAVANFALSKVQAAAPAPPPAPAVSIGTPPPATFGGVYTFLFTATGGAGPYTFSKVSGLMPPGLTLSNTGLLSGSVDPNATPLASATGAGAAHFMAVGMSPVSYAFGVEATGSDGRASAPVSVTVLVNPEPTITFTPTNTPLPGPTPSGLLGLPSPPTLTGTAPANGFLIQTPPGDMTVPYSQTFGVVGGTAPYRWSISSGPPNPFGLSLSSAGVLSGTPTSAANEGLIAVRVTDATGASVDGQVDIDIYQSPTYTHPTFVGYAFNANGFAEFDAGMSLNAGLGFTPGGAGVAGLTISQGAMPSCLKLFSGEGFELSGTLTPSCVGTFNFTIRLTDLMGGFADSIPLKLQVNPPLTVSDPPAGSVGQSAYIWVPVAGGGHPGTSYQVFVPQFSLPSGLTVNQNNPPTDLSTKSVTGSPSVAGSFPMSVQVVDTFLNKSAFIDKTLQVTGSIPLQISGAPRSFADVTGTYAGGYSATGGSGKYTFSFTANSITPAGMTIDASTGAISGSVTAKPGNYTNVQAQVCDSNGNPSAPCPSSTVTVTVSPAPALTVNQTSNWTHAVVGVDYSLTPNPVTFSLSGGSGFSFFTANLPAGMFLNGCTSPCSSAPVGTPSYMGTTQVTVTATDAAGMTTAPITGTFVVDRSPNLPTVTGTTTIQATAVGTNMDQTCFCSVASVTGGTPFDPNVNPNSYAISSKPLLPAGVTFKIEGTSVILSGTPTVASPLTTYKLLATDAAGQTGGALFQFVVEASGPTLSAAPPGWDVGIPYTMPDGKTPVKLVSTTGTAPFTWAVVSPFSVPVLVDCVCNGGFGFAPFGGVLPPGLTLGADGTISGTPTKAGTYTVDVTSTDALNVVSSITVQIAIADPTTLAISAPANPISGQSYADAFSVTGGTHPYTWTLVSGSPPAGLTLDRFFHLTGTPTAPVGTSSTVTVKVTDLAGATATKTVTLTVSAPPAASVKPASPNTPAPSPTPSPSPSLPASPSPSPSASASPRSSASPSPSSSPSPSAAAPSPSSSPTPTPTPTPTPAATPVASTPAPSPSAIPTASPSPSPSPTK